MPTDPARLGSGFSATSPIDYWVHLRSDVARLDVDLTDGERLTLMPVEVAHTRLALFQVPRRVGITRITAYAADESAIAYSVPYQSPDAAVVAMWYRPDQAATEPEVGGTLSGVTAKGVKGSAEVHIGPFGICYTTQHRWSGLANTTCDPLAVPTSPSDAVPDSMPDWIALGDQVDPKVDHVDFLTSKGTCRAEKVRIGGHAFAVCFFDPGFTVISRTFYDSSGKVIAYEPTPTKP